MPVSTSQNGSLKRAVPSRSLELRASAPQDPRGGEVWRWAVACGQRGLGGRQRPHPRPDALSLSVVRKEGWTLPLSLLARVSTYTRQSPSLLCHLLPPAHSAQSCLDFTDEGTGYSRGEQTWLTSLKWGDSPPRTRGTVSRVRAVEQRRVPALGSHTLPTSLQGGVTWTPPASPLAPEPAAPKSAQTPSVLEMPASRLPCPSRDHLAPEPASSRLPPAHAWALRATASGSSQGLSAQRPRRWALLLRLGESLPVPSSPCTSPG